MADWAAMTIRTHLILGGSAEAYVLADRLAARPESRVISSLAGRTGAPRLPAGEVRIGGFGGPEGLAAYLRDHGIDVVVDCTHPFAARMGWNAAAACAAAGVPLLRLERPAWVAQPGDLWDEVADWPAAAARLGAGARRVLLAVGRQELAPFADVAGVWFLIRTVAPPDPLPAFAQAELLLARGPFSLDSERHLLAARRIDTIVCKNSGGPTEAKLTAARELGLRVVMKTRPRRPEVPCVADAGEALRWLEDLPEA